MEHGHGYRPEEVANFLNRVKGEFMDPLTAFAAIGEWNKPVYEDLAGEAETVGQARGRRAAGLYIFGASLAFWSMQEENGGLPPPADPEALLASLTDDPPSEEILRLKFPMTTIALAVQGQMLTEEYPAAGMGEEKDFESGANKTIKMVLALLASQE